ncbi:hypothetical protein ACFTWD_03255 [Streptomyces sp. NPDC056943]|uniref:hypothetical protein n=1 Tax=Streptomyces sp. NPDC056943 TaxID=3345971 RepID=UPI00362B983C
MFRRHSQPLVTAPAGTAVLTLLLAEGQLSRVELARRTGLSSTVVTITPLVVMFLVAQRYIVEGIATSGLKG